MYTGAEGSLSSEMIAPTEPNRKKEGINFIQKPFHQVTLMEVQRVVQPIPYHEDLQTFLWI